MFQKLKYFQTHASQMTNVLIGTVLYVLLLIFVLLAISPERYGLEVGMPAPNTIMATKEVVDTVTTQTMRERAANAVEPSYKKAEGDVTTAVLSAMDGSFHTLIELAGTDPEAEMATITDEQLQEVREKIDPVQIEKGQLAALLSHDSTTVNAAFQKARNLIRDSMNSLVSEGQENEAISALSRELAKTYDSSLTAVAANVARAHLKPNMIIDVETTDAARQRAMEAVEPVTRVKGEAIVRAGEIVSKAQYEMLKTLGMVESEAIDMPMYYGVALFLLFTMLACVGLLYAFVPHVLQDTKKVLLIAIVCVLTVLFSLLIRSLNAYLMPVSMGLLLIALLIGSRAAMVVNILLAVVAAILAPGSSGMFSATMYTLMITPIMVSPLAFIVFRKSQQRTMVLFTGLIIGAGNMLTVLALGFINNSDVAVILMNGLWSAASGVLSGMFCIALQPIFEWMFNLVTATKLLELSNPAQPLLKRLMLEAPGTYHHAMVVANLAEAAASAVGANSLLARVGAYYHDVGKLKRPMYFKENQMGDNPHDRTDPRVSASIITAHVREGVQIAQKERLPEAIVDIIRFHHGDTPVVYFYDKATKLYGADKVDPADYRYDGPRPKTRESAIIMLADAVEAAERSMQNPDPEKMRNLLNRIIRTKMEDGQLDGCELTFKDLDRIREAFETVLAGVFHERIEYPMVDIPHLEREEHKDNGKV